MLTIINTKMVKQGDSEPNPKPQDNLSEARRTSRTVNGEVRDAPDWVSPVIPRSCKSVLEQAAFSITNMCD